MFVWLCVRVCVCRPAPCWGQGRGGQWFPSGWNGTGAGHPDCGEEEWPGPQPGTVTSVCLLNSFFLHPIPTTNQQARSQGTIIFKVVPITEQPVHRQTMVSLQICPHHVGLGSPAHFPFVFVCAAVRAGYGRLLPPARPRHSLRRCRRELQARRHPGDRGPE